MAPSVPAGRFHSPVEGHERPAARTDRSEPIECGATGHSSANSCRDDAPCTMGRVGETARVVPCEASDPPYRAAPNRTLYGSLRRFSGEHPSSRGIHPTLQAAKRQAPGNTLTSHRHGRAAFVGGRFEVLLSATARRWLS